ncbi:3-hydroxyacyl-CoA dehydrogenase family protein [Halobellus salinisoli]|uniref:3-hydroxyacyl-CoA dehydrogenase family protein n=1 Tax=Halobellus salinisoli TaxID=3108500 RepID=UPI00300BEF84
MSDSIESVAVVGGGIMGGDIGQVLAQAGYDVNLRDVEEDALADTEDRIKNGNYGLGASVEGGYITAEERDATLDRLTFTLDLDEALDDVDAVFEAVPEDLALKGDVFREIDNHTEGIPLFSNTSGLSVTALANAVEDRSRFAVTHFFSPVPVMDLVEIVRAPQTDDRVIEVAQSIAEDLDKTYITIEDTTEEYGFVANRCYFALMEEAERVVDEGIATEEQVNTALKEGFNHPIGPFELIGTGNEWD